VAKDEKNEDKPSRFFSDAHRKSYIAALVREREQYEQRAEAAKAAEDAEAVEKWQGRVEQVAAELKAAAGKAGRGRGAEQR